MKKIKKHNNRKADLNDTCKNHTYNESGYCVDENYENKFFSGLFFHLFLIIVLFLFICSFSSAQSKDFIFKQTIGINPVLVFTGTINAEYERTSFLNDVSLGLTGWYEFKNKEIQWAYIKGIYYPSGEVLKGLGFGPTFGALYAYRDKDKPEQTDDDYTFTLGGLVQYNRFLGKNDNILIGVGLGGRAALKSIEKNSPLRKFEGDVRLSAGIAL